MQINTVQEHMLQGIKEYEPRVVHQLLDFMYRNVAEVLQVAEVTSCGYIASYLQQSACKERQLLTSQSQGQCQDADADADVPTLEGCKHDNPVCICWNNTQDHSNM